ncbi:MG2 domain-containing protein [Amphritea sp. 1_MG-2023]|uniref:alpha-2-macroglobulin family protein n=1 Tax=Amphritea sp. 1_MG-2023 TaxID=3062670 RepID=UPI0026E15C55|nr:MG2 domain-containing protein [Amphritea sp. 1_MG-2023]MDO6564243.1 MG2 domain-containing protein [Amphritea sp. 1_MG-2023]
MLRASILCWLMLLLLGCSDEADTRVSDSTKPAVSTPVAAANVTSSKATQDAAAITATTTTTETATTAETTAAQSALVKSVVAEAVKLTLHWQDKFEQQPVVRDGVANSVEIHADISGAEGLDATHLASLFHLSDSQARVSVVIDEGQRPHLTISDIQRAVSCAQELTVSWGEAQEQRFIVPTLSGADKRPLELLSAAIDDNAEVLELRFNRQLKQDQALKHLISSRYRFTSYQMDNNRVRLGLNNSATEKLSVTIHKELQDRCDIGLATSLKQSFTIAPHKPGVRFAGSGIILPDATRIELPFQAVSAKSVTVTAFEVFEDNVHQFLQENRLTDARSLAKVGRFIWQKSVPLKDNNLRSWQDYRLDITELMAQKGGSLIRLYLSLDRGDSMIACSDAENAIPIVSSTLPQNAEALDYSGGYSSWDNVEPGASRTNNFNACDDRYYRVSADAKAAKNLLRSNIGLVVKQGPAGDTARVIATNLKTSAPLSESVVELFNFQGQSVGKGETDSDGFAKIKLKGKPFYLEARTAEQVGYLKLNDAGALTTSQFDIGGSHLQSNIDGFIFAERDVWRPGDDIYLTFMLKDKLNELPTEHPVVADLYNPSGQLVESVYSNQPVGRLYSFKLATAESAPTGNWEAIVRLGGQDFHHPLRIETVVPNRLKIELDIPRGERLQNGQTQAVSLQSNWLHGAPASGLEADVAVTLIPVTTSFAGKFPDYSFDDPARDYRARKMKLFEGTLDEQGSSGFDLHIDSQTPPPGMLKAVFTNRVFEQSGQYSSNRFSRSFDYYDRYLGLQLPKGDAERGMLLTDEDHKTRLVVLDSAGQPVSQTNLDITVYKLDWKWWYEKSSESLARYADGRHTTAIASGQVVTDDNGMAEWPLRVNYPQWGRYLVRACIAGQDSHCSGKVVYIDWPGWAGRQQESQGDHVDRLTLFSDKKSYSVGDTATITLPELHHGRALITVESAHHVLQQFWVKAEQSNAATQAALQQQVNIDISAEMAPNVYVSVTYLQPHENRDNDRPMRLMGIIPLAVENPDNHLHPLITTEGQVQSRATFDIQVAEAAGRPMAYSLALVDEGLLGLTNYRTPDPFDYFYRRQALQVKTWDLYKDVVGAYSGELHGLLPVGGSDAQKDDDKSNKNRRFPPLVQYLGRFELQPDETRQHQVTLPMYLGAVRVMVIAEDGAAYGKAEASVVVRDDISMFPTLPRVLRIGEQASVPVELFNNTANEAAVKVMLSTDAERVTVAQASTDVTLAPYSSALAEFAIQTGELMGKTAFTFTTQSAEAEHSQTLYLDINAPNAPATRITTQRVDSQTALDLKLQPFGIPGSNVASIALSQFKPIHLRSRLDYLVNYPHGCLEQTTSSVFPQLYLHQLSTLAAQQVQQVQQNVIAAIARLQSFQTLEGGFAYWPGQSQSHAWGSSYAGHFLLLAKQAGYDVPEYLLQQWLAYQHQASEFAVDSSDAEKIKAQAYRLFTLSLAGEPNWSAMYRLQALPLDDSVSVALLSLAYLNAGQEDVARALIADGLTTAESYDSNSPSFASALRDKALFLMLYANIAEPEIAVKLADEIADKLAEKRWYSTQTAAYALVALANYQQFSQHRAPEATPVEVLLQQAQAVQRVTVGRQVTETSLNGAEDEPQLVNIRNNGETAVWLTLTQSGVAGPGSEQVYAEGLALQVDYLNSDGAEANIRSLKQGSNITAQIKLRNTTVSDLTNVALNFRAPSGWQIDNEREACSQAACQFDYVDIRDDRVSGYMGLKAGEEKSLSLQLNASFIGRFYLPAISAYAMYDETIKAQLKGFSVEVVQ